LLAFLLARFDPDLGPVFRAPVKSEEQNNSPKTGIVNASAIVLIWSQHLAQITSERPSFAMTKFQVRFIVPDAYEKLIVEENPRVVASRIVVRQSVSARG